MARRLHLRRGRRRSDGVSKTLCQYYFGSGLLFVTNPNFRRKGKCAQGAVSPEPFTHTRCM